MVFLIRISNKKIPKMKNEKCKKKPPCQFAQVDLDLLV